MATKWEKVHVFISSTFKDMHAERDYLVKRVFPQLNEWCEQRRLRLVDIDLRWGVTEQDAQNRNVVKVCLDKIDACRPFFLCFLGQRRGWVPKYRSNSADESNDIPLSTISEFPSLEKYAGITSVTELEIVHALVDPLHRGRQRDPERPGEYYEPAEYAFFYLRDDSYLEQIASPELRKIYTNDSAEDDQELNKWRNEKIPATGRPKRAYTARWDSNLNTPELGLPGRLTDFQHQSSSLDNIILEDLKAAISARYPHHVGNEELTDLQKEIDQQELFLFSGSEGFISRGDDFKELNDYVNGPSDRLFVLTAPGGMGKSTLLAKWIELQRSHTGARVDQSVFFRFVGQSDRSLTVYSLLSSLMLEIKDRTGRIDKEIPEDPRSLRQEWTSLLAEAAKRGKLIIVIDALNQLSTGLSDLAWLPIKLPENVKLIVSFKRGEPAAEETLLRIKDQVEYAEVKPFEELFHRQALVNAYLDQYLKQLDARHLEMLVNLPGAKNPLYLKVILSELRVFGAFANLGEKIRSDFGIDPISAFEGVLKRLEQDPAYSPLDPQAAVPRMFALLAHAQRGLSTSELAAMLVQDLGLEDTDRQRQAVLDTTYLFLRQVRPFIANRAGRYDFFFESFKLAALRRYVGTGDFKRPAQAWHRVLAEYYATQPLEIELDQRRLPNTQKLIEQPYQQVYAGLGDALIRTLTTYRFLEMKIVALGLQPVLEDFDLALLPDSVLLRASDREDLSSVRVLLEQKAHVLENDPQQLAAQLWLCFSNNDQPAVHQLIADMETSVGHAWLRYVSPGGGQSGSVLRRTLDYSLPIASIQFCRQGKTLFLAGEKTVKALDTVRGFTEAGSCSTSQMISRFSAREDGKRGFYFTQNIRGLGVLDLEGFKEINHTILADVSTKSALVSSQDGSALVVGSYGGYLSVWDLAAQQEIHSFPVHSGRITAAAISADGKLVVTGGDDCQVRVFLMASGEPVHCFEGHQGSIGALASTADGAQVLSGDQRGAIKIWDLETGSEAGVLTGHHNYIKSILVSPDNRWGVTTSEERCIVWYRSGWHQAHSFAARDLGAAAVSIDGRFLAIAGSTLDVYDLDTGEQVASFEGHEKKVTHLEISTDGRWLALAAQDNPIKLQNNSIRVWNLRQHRLAHAFTGLTRPALHLRINNRLGQVLALLQTDSSSKLLLKVWDLDSGQELSSFELEIQSSGGGVLISPDGETLFTAKYAHEENADLLGLWDPQGNLVKGMKGHDKRIGPVVLDPVGRVVYTGWSDEAKTYALFGLALEEGEKTAVLHTHLAYGSATVLRVSPSGRYAALGLQSGVVAVLDFQKQELIQLPAGQQASAQATQAVPRCAVVSVEITSDERCIVAVHADKTIQVLDLPMLKPLYALEAGVDTLGLPVLDHPSVWLENGTLLKIRSRADDENLSEIRIDPAAWVGHPDLIALSGDGKRAIRFESLPMYGYGYKAEGAILDIVSCEVIAPLAGHANDVRALAVSPDDSYAVSGSSDRTARVWNLSGTLSPNASSQAMQFSHPVGHLRFTPDGAGLVAAAERGTIKAWSLADFAELYTLSPGRDNQIIWTRLYLGSAIGLAFGTYGTSGGSNRVFIFNLETQESLAHMDVPTDFRNNEVYIPLRNGGQVLYAEKGEGTSQLQNLALLDLGTGEKTGLVEGMNFINRLVVSPDESKALVGWRESPQKSWYYVVDLADQNLLLEKEIDDASLRGLCIITPDGKVVDTSYPNKLRKWDMKTGEDIKVVPGADLLALAAAGDLLVEKTARHIRVLDLATLEPRDLFECWGGSLSVLNRSLEKLLEIAPNGRWLAAGYGDWGIRIWDLHTSRVVTTFTADSYPNTCTFSPDSGSIAIGFKSGKIYLMKLEGVGCD
jgi:WD40 repeat protein